MAEIYTKFDGFLASDNKLCKNEHLIFNYLTAGYLISLSCVCLLGVSIRDFQGVNQGLQQRDKFPDSGLHIQEHVNRYMNRSSCKGATSSPLIIQATPSTA